LCRNSSHHSSNPASSKYERNSSRRYPVTTGLGDALFNGAAEFTIEDYEVRAAT
jgi:hypothetical protein